MKAASTALAILFAIGLAASAEAQDHDYGTDGFLGRLGEDTGDVDRCSPTDLPDDERTRRAADHYDRGLVLYEQGDYAGAIEQFVASYCDQPHPSGFYNIGLCYERLLEYDRALAYFERYILESEPDAPNRKRAMLRAEVLEKTPAQIRVATVPPGASVTLSGETGLTARGVANADEPIAVRQGRYELHVEMPGFQPVVQEIVARIGQPYSYYVRLEPEKGVVRIAASPSNARIFLDQKLVGLGSYVETVPIGTYDVVIEAENREPEARSIEVTTEATTDISVQLEAPPKSGRTALIWASSLGLGIAGSTAFGAVVDTDTELTTLSGLLGIGLGWSGAYLGVPDDIPRTDAWYIIGTSVIGAVEGSIVMAFVSCDDDGTGTGGRNCSDDAIAGGGLATAVGGLVFAAVTARHFDLDAGDIALIDSAAVWGLGTGGMFAAIFDGDPRIQEPMLFAGLNLGLVAGVTLAARSDVSMRRVALIDLSGLAGLVGGYAVGAAADAGDERAEHFTLVGMATGLIAGTFLTRNLDEPDPDVGTLRPAARTATDSSGRPVVTYGAEMRF